MRPSRSFEQVGPRRCERGYVLQSVLVLLALLAIGVVLTLRDTAFGLQDAAHVRATVEIRGAMEQGLNLALSAIGAADPADLTDPSRNWDIFSDPPAPFDFIPASLYPPSGPLAGAYNVRVGLRRGQLAQGTTGQATDDHYGQIFEIQILAEAVGSGLPPTEERLTVSVLVPRERSHAN